MLGFLLISSRLLLFLRNFRSSVSVFLEEDRFAFLRFGSALLLLDFFGNDDDFDFDDEVVSEWLFVLLLLVLLLLLFLAA